MLVDIAPDLIPEKVVKRAMFLAYQASRTAGMGVFQARDGITEDDVWKNAYNNGDYPGGRMSRKTNDVYGDYVFGRMMKVGFKWTDRQIEVREEQPRPDYQSWAFQYRSYRDLIDAAVTSLKNAT